MPQIIVEYSLDADGILKVAASEKSSGNTKEIEIKSDDMKLDDKEMERMKADADKYKEEDDKRVENIKMRNQLENFLYNKKNEIDAVEDQSMKEKLGPILNEGLEWLDNNNVADTDTYERMIKDFTEKLGM
jgi:molecular chaperone DnaK (HSP70)